MIKLFWWCHGQKLWRQKPFQNTLILKRPRVAIFADIIKVVTIFTKTIFKDSKKKKKGIRNYYQNSVYICFSSCNKIYRFSVKKCWCQQISRGVLRDSHDFWIFFRYNCTKFHHCRIYMTDFRKGEPFCPASMKNPKKVHPE